MKKILFLLVFVLGGLAQEGDRVQLLEDYGVQYRGHTASLFFSRWHDKASGVEFICAENSRWNNDAGISCFPTGRKW